MAYYITKLLKAIMIPDKAVTFHYVTAGKEIDSLIIVEDKGQQDKKHEIKHIWFDWHAVELIRAPLPVGDYILYTDAVADVIKRKTSRGIDVKKMDFLGSYDISVDTKKDMQEICGNVCGKQHARFRDECILAQNNGIKLYVLIENEDGIKDIQDVLRWQNPRLHRYNQIKSMHSLGKWQSISLPKAPPTNGETLAKALLTMQTKYGVEFLFCRPEESGARILKLLGVEAVDGAS